MKRRDGCAFCGAQGPDPELTAGRGYARLRERNPHLPPPGDVLRFELVGDSEEDAMTITVTMAVRIP